MLLLLLTFFTNITPAFTGISAICFGDLRLDLPVRHLYLQLTEDGKNVTESKGTVECSLDEESERHVADVVDRGDGMYVFRLQLRRSVPMVTIRLSLNGTALCDSPIVLTGYENRNLNPEYCNCPIELDQWLELANCPPEPQIDEDLRPFPIINFEKVLQKAVSIWGQSSHSRTYSFCHYQILQNKVYRKCYGEYTGFRVFLDKTLASVLRKMSLPDTEFLFNLGDYPLSLPEDAIPLVSWCGSKSTLDLVFPTYTYAGQITEYYLQDFNIHRTGNSLPWEKKLDKAVFRGRDSNKLRLFLARLSDETNSSFLDAGITAYFFFDEADNSPKRDRIPFNDFFMYKYIISVDGTVAAYRFPSLLVGTSLILKSDSEYYEHFYRKMEPYAHYIPFNRGNVEEVLKWVRENDHNETIRNQRQFVLDHLQPKNMYCYFAQFFKTYTGKLIEKPFKVVKGGESSELHFSKCDCMQRKQEL